ncbi:D-glycero-alpha-D-manno-heptose-1,7-bisphosphate 7-phosphatase [Taibaiella koreensis]|uniref:D-glycero-alpha-D-manno-heptose-1,7-bisphosphate 7-phosphatase n=1 Tax=Taibaiella koreensis TaxID=1268548 RepID=UPI000E599ADC|nr:HAD family hydrolase [Taibaiella koreensis]
MASALFLDRDGVINEEKEGSYIFHKDEFVFYPGAVAALVALSGRFDYVFIVTNQRGVGRGYMTEAALLEIHDHLTEAVVAAGGKIDRIYFAPFVDSNHSHRKPNAGMGLDAQKDFPDIDFEQSVMVGNNLSDMQFGKTLGMKTIFLHTTQPAIVLPHPLIDEQYDSLLSWSREAKV